MPSPEKVDLRKTDVENWLLTQETSISRKDNKLFYSTSYVKLIDGCLLLKYSRKFTICDFCLKITKVSSM